MWINILGNFCCVIYSMCSMQQSNDVQRYSFDKGIKQVLCFDVVFILDESPQRVA